MNKLIITFVSILLITATNTASAQKKEKMKFDDNEIVGTIKVKQLEQLDGFEAISIHEQYKGDKKQLEQLANLLQGVSVEAYIGTWCEDTQYWLPQIFQLLHQASYPAEQIKTIGLDKNKKTPEGIEIEKKITHVPTIIFYKDGKELGRMVEQPKKTLIQDFIKILSAN